MTSANPTGAEPNTEPSTYPNIEPKSENRFEVFFDGDCPLCMKEIRFLKRRDAENQRLRFTDIAKPDFSPAELGVTHSLLMAKIHGRMPSGELVTGVEVFRQLYAAIGFSRSVWMSRLPGISHVLNLFYWLFAKNRLRLTGRCDSSSCEIKSASAS